jgi:release factor H-coupled RctB family protein
MKSGRIKQEKIARKLYGLEESWDGDSAAWLKSFGVDRPSHEFALGTIGLGNHFMEIQTVDEIIDDNVCRTAGIDKEWLYLLIHSGSRTKGEALLRGHVDKHRDAGLDANSEDGGLYLEAHDECLRWAHANRSLIARRVFDLLDVDGGEICDLPHNFVEESESGGVKGFIHRKGATSSDRGITVVPGSRGSLTYIVQPVPNGASINSIAHGAGRKWARSDCMDRLKGRFTKESLARTELGGMVICEDKDLLFEEAPMAYKKIEKVISIMQDSGLIKVIATMKPVITYKVRR